MGYPDGMHPVFLDGVEGTGTKREEKEMMLDKKWGSRKH